MEARADASSDCNAACIAALYRSRTARYRGSLAPYSIAACSRGRWRAAVLSLRELLQGLQQILMTAPRPYFKQRPTCSARSRNFLSVAIDWSAAAMEV